MKRTKQATHEVSNRLNEIFALLTDDEKKQLAAIAASNQPEAPKPPKAKAPKAPKISPEAWVTYKDASGAAHMGKAKNAPKDAQSIEAHKTQGKALQALNAMRKAEAEAPAPKPEAAPAPEVEASPAPADDMGRAQRRDAKNAAIIATIPYGKDGAMRRKVENKLKQLHKAGYRYARLERNKNHQLDGLHIYPGDKGRGREKAFMDCTTKAAKEYRIKADKARESGKPRPKPPVGTFVWSPVGGGNLYARGIFGPVDDK